jgi:hypothetical protein
MAYRYKVRPVAPVKQAPGVAPRIALHRNRLVISARSAFSAMGVGALFASPLAVCAAAYLDSVPLGLICGGLGFVTTAPLLAR